MRGGLCSGVDRERLLKKEEKNKYLIRYFGISDDHRANNSRQYFTLLLCDFFSSWSYGRETIPASETTKCRNACAEDLWRNSRRITRWYLVRPGAKHSWAVKGAKGRRSVLNVTQPRRKAKLQLVQSTDPFCTLPSFRDALLPAVISRRRERVKS